MRSKSLLSLARNPTRMLPKIDLELFWTHGTIQLFWFVYTLFMERRLHAKECLCRNSNMSNAGNILYIGFRINLHEKYKLTQQGFTLFPNSNYIQSSKETKLLEWSLMFLAGSEFFKWNSSQWIYIVFNNVTHNMKDVGRTKILTFHILSELNGFVALENKSINSWEALRYS